MADLRNDIERYWKGELSPAEMHELEKKALSDPFLADALEGAGQIPANDFSSDLAMLRGQLAGEKSKSVIPWVWVARIAAGLAVLGIVAYLVISGNQSDPIRIAENKVTEKPTAKKDEDVQSAGNLKKESDSVLILDQHSSRDQTQKKADRVEEPKSPDEMEVGENAGEDERIASRASAVETSPAVSYSTDEATSPPVEILQQAPSAAGAPAPSDDAIDKMQGFLSAKPKKIITGTVLDAEDGRGLAGVNVMVPGTSEGTSTDEEGRYKIATDSIEAGLQFSFIGYENKEVSIASSDNINVELDPDLSELSEVVVVGYGAEKYKNEDPLANASILLASPSGGKKAFKQYLEQNLKYPERALNNQIEGRVVVQFTIETSGKLSNFQVVKGLGYGCDEEVIRLIKQGPKWRPSAKNTQPVTDKVKVRMKFSLPKK